MTIATGVAKVVAYKIESAWGTAPGTSGGKQLRRVTSDLSLDKQTYESNEIRTDYQVADMRHGVRSVTGSVDGELSPGSYQDMMASALRRAFTAVTALTAVGLTIAVSGSVWTVTRTAGDFLATGGIKVGMVVRFSVGGLNAANLNKNLFILALTTTIMTVIPLNGVALFAEGPIAGCTITAPGMKTYAPITGHIDQSVAVEHWHADVAQSELFVGLKVQTQEIALPPTGMSTIKTQLFGKDIITATAQYFVTPAAAGTAGVLASVNGAIMANGLLVALLTGLTLTIDANQTAEPVVGSNVYPDIQEGRIRVKGQMTVMFQDGAFRDYFINETEVAIAMAFSTSNAALAEFIAFSLPRIKAGGARKNDGERALVQTIPFTALIPINGGNTFDHEQSTLTIQDSLAA